MLASGARIASLRLESRIGRGGMGEVWRARQDGLSAPVAVKLLHADPARREDRARAFLVEAQSVAALDHPHIVSILDFGLLTEEEAQGVGLWPGCPWMATELLTGGSLRERQPSGWPELRGWLEALLDALAHAHARGLIHRDLKPDNVLFDDAGVLRVVDFGLVLQLDKAGTEAPFSGGTPVAMAPEQLSGDWRRQGPWTDLYALGCLGWRLATGRWPHEAAGLPELAAAHAAGRLPPFVPRLALPDGVEAWLRALLRPAARSRPAPLLAASFPARPQRGGPRLAAEGGAARAQPSPGGGLHPQPRRLALARLCTMAAAGAEQEAQRPDAAALAPTRGLAGVP